MRSCREEKCIQSSQHKFWPLVGTAWAGSLHMASSGSRVSVRVVLVFQSVWSFDLPTEQR